MDEEKNEKSYVNPDFTAAFKRVRDILKDLRDNRIKPLREGNAYNFRNNINNSIGTIPKTDEATGAIVEDGVGMSGAVFAMGEAFEEGLGNLGDALNQFDTDAQDILTKATESKDKILEYERTAKASESAAKTSADNAKISETNAKTSEINSKESEVNAKTSETNAKNSETNAKTYEDGVKNFADNLQSYVDGKIDDAVKEATDAAEAANKAAQGITNTFVCLAQGNSATETEEAGSYPVTVDAEGNETRIIQSQGAVWFKIISEVNTSTENTENTGETENTEIV